MQPFPPFSGEAYLNVATVVKSVATGQTVPLSRRVVALSLYNVLGHLTDQTLTLVGDAPGVQVLTAVELPDATAQALFFQQVGGEVDGGVQQAWQVPAWAIPLILDLIKKFLEGALKTS